MFKNKLTITFSLLLILFSLSLGHDIFNYFKSSLGLKIEPTRVHNAPTTIQHTTSTVKYPDNPLPPHTQEVTQSNSIELLRNKPVFKCPRPQLQLRSNGKPYFVLNTNLDNNNSDFLVELTRKLNRTFQHIESLLGITLNRTITLNMVFQPSRVQYEDYIVSLGRSPVGNIGMYLGSKNIAIIETSDIEIGMKTAIHEAIHAFNYAYWGSTFRFFNEGMAEYFEVITLTGKIPSFNFSYLQHQDFPEQIFNLLFLEADWHGQSNYGLYQNSKALFYFLMSSEVGRDIVLNIMKLEMAEPCQKLPKGKIEDVFIELYSNHQQEFDYWFIDGKAAFFNTPN